MLGIGLLICLAIYIAIIKLLVRIIPSRTHKAVLVFMAVAFPLIYPFLHKIYPSYHQFISLCEASDRKIIHSIKHIDYLYLGSSSMCKNGFEDLANYKGIECDYKPKENREPGNDRGTFRYIRGENWSSPSCGENCLTKPYRIQKEECQLSCMESVKIEKFTNPFDHRFIKKEIIINKLYLNESTIIDGEEVLAVLKNYIYYPYGNTWAKILGASSSLAPRSYCENKLFIHNTEVYKPNGS
ncbi:MAG: hypothetical protein HRU20_15980 [Pseudomonadales bacterium]|nr:hypothetical protein [Pseudomonadales bacterium]